mmetsp:Transcript_18136/g.51638  ORF Transcript_18136/g.51638 Transcript_18136/m.51638 type:complete len:236 (+) Transcript_18136:534-1241(+)
MVDYGYGDAAPDVAGASASADPYGYGDASPDVSKYGYGDAAPDGEYQATYNDQDAAGGKMRRYKRGDGNESDDNMSTSSAQSVDSNGQPKPPRPHRARRRNSVTRYSLVANEEAANVAREHEDNVTRIEQFRQGLLNGQGLDMVPGSNVPHFSGASIGDAAQGASYTSEADRILQQQLEDDDEPLNNNSKSSRALSTTSSDGSVDENGDPKKDRKKGNRLGRGMRAIGRRFSVGA